MQNNETEQAPEPKKPDDTGSIQINDYLKITDPETGEVLVNKRDS